jgi:type IV pilus assembly protein PilE
MEQYYQDNRTYDGKSSPCASIAKVGEFSFKCEYEESKYKVTASGAKSVADFAYTIDQDGSMATTSLPANWGSTTPASCWIIRPGGSC